MRIEMDQELQSYLHSLKQLYGLLQNGFSTMLDEKSKLLLKDLLDSAAENVFNIHSKKGKNCMEFTGSGNDLGFNEPLIQKLCSGKQTLSVGMGGSEDMDMHCRVCQRPKPSVESSTFATRKGTKSSALSVDEKVKLRSSVSFSKSPDISEDSEHSGSTYLDCISSGSESTNYASNNCRSYLSKQASDAIKKIDIRILDLQRAAQNLEIIELRSKVQELSDRMNGVVLQPVSSKTKFDPQFNVEEILGSHRKGGHSKEARKFQPSLGQHESDASLSRKTSISCSGSEEYYHPRYETQRLNYVKSPTRESDKYSVSGDVSQEFSVISGDDGEVYSWRSSDGPYASTSCTSYERKRNSLSTSGNSCQASYSGDDDTEGYKPKIKRPRQPKDFSVGSTSTKKMRPRRVSSSIWKNPGKKIGRWKKLKDRLPSIFHPHHHHGHVHNQKHTDCDHDDLRSSENRKAYTRLPSKHIERQAVEKYGNALIHGSDSKMVQKSVNAMRALFKHARRAKRSRLSAKKIKPLKGSKSGHTTAKRNWLKILQHHKKAKKLGLDHRR